MNSSKQWLEYFKANSREVLELPQHDDSLNADEVTRISSSIQAFQKGEASEGVLLKEKALAYGRSIDDPHYVECIKYLIREENRHSAYLSQFMRIHAIRPMKHNWTDSVFRKLRNLFGLETSVRVLVTAELVAVKYYGALGDATRSNLLKSISQRMLREEAAHIEFQMQTIHKINSQKSPFAAAVADLLHGLLMAFTIIIVWREHRQVLSTQHSFKSFFASVYDLFCESMDQGRESAEIALRNPLRYKREIYE